MTSICFPLENSSKVEGCHSKEWVIKDSVGKGFFGEVWKACCQTNCSYVLKYQKFVNRGINKNTREQMINEVDMQDKFANLGLAMPVLDHWMCEKGSVIVMKALKITVNQLIMNYPNLEAIKEIIEKCMSMLNELHIHGYYHGDNHLDNIMVDYTFAGSSLPDTFDVNDYKFYFIDMGHAGKLPEDDDHEVGNWIAKDYRSLYYGLMRFRDEDDKLYAIVQPIADCMFSELEKFEDIELE